MAPRQFSAGLEARVHVELVLVGQRRRGAATGVNGVVPTLHADEADSVEDVDDALGRETLRVVGEFPVQGFPATFEAFFQGGSHHDIAGVLEKRKKGTQEGMADQIFLGEVLELPAREPVRGSQYVVLADREMARLVGDVAADIEKLDGVARARQRPPENVLGRRLAHDAHREQPFPQLVPGERKSDRGPRPGERQILKGFPGPGNADLVAVEFVAVAEVQVCRRCPHG